MKAQGMPINMVVIIALALLVLIVVGVFFMTGGSQLFGQIGTVSAGTTGSADVTALRAACQQACNELSLTVYSQQDVSSSRYCTLSLEIVDATGTAKDTYCNAVIPTCRVSTQDGQTRTIGWTGSPDCESATSSGRDSDRTR